MFSWPAKKPKAPVTPFRAPWHKPITVLVSKPWPIRCAAACVPCGAISGCSAWGIRMTSRCGFALNCCGVPTEWGPSQFCVKKHRFAWICRIVRGATYSFWAWIIPRAPKSSMCRSTWESMGGMPVGPGPGDLRLQRPAQHHVAVHCQQLFVFQIHGLFLLVFLR